MHPRMTSTPPGSWRCLRARAVDLWHDRGVQQSVGIVIGLRVALGVVAWASVVLIPTTIVGGDWRELQAPPSDHLWALIQPWQRWDALWYQHIAMSGYSGSDVVFFPLYPALMHVAGVLLGGHSTQYALGGLLISTVSLGVALVLLHRLVSRDLSAAVADRSILYIAISPAAFFFFAPFTESLFLALTVGAVLAARKRSWLIAAVAASGAALTRPTGILIMVPLLIEMGIDVFERRQRHLPPFRWQHAVMVLLPLNALGFYYVLYILPAGGLGAAESPWNVHFLAPWTAVYESVRAVASGAHPEEALNLISALALMISVPIMCWRLPWSYTAYAAVSILPVACRTALISPLASAGRYALVVFPLFVLIALAGRRPVIDRMVTVGFPVLMTFLLVLFVHYVFVG